MLPPTLVLYRSRHMNQSFHLKHTLMYIYQVEQLSVKLLTQ